MRRGLVAGVLTAVACAVVGVWVVLRGLNFMGDALAHGVIPGLLVGPPATATLLVRRLPVMGVSVLSGVLAVYLGLRLSHHLDLAVGASMAAVAVAVAQFLAVLAVREVVDATLSRRRTRLGRSGEEFATATAAGAATVRRLRAGRPEREYGAMDLEQERDRARTMWALGDYTRLAELLSPAADALVEAAGVAPGDRVLDVATGTGNAALAAARRGATVTGADLTPRMLELAGARAVREGVELELVEADLEDLPFPGGAFDVVVSVFGVIFAPRPAAAVAELARVLRPGGRLALTSWWEGGYVGRMGELVGERLPPLPPGTADVSAWGRPAFLAQVLGGAFTAVRSEVRSLPWRFPSAPATRAYWEAHSPSHVAAKRALPPELVQAMFDAIEEQAAAAAGPDGVVSVDAGYLLCTAARAA